MTRPVNLDAQLTSLAAFNPTKLDRFGGRYRVVLGGMYRVARECVLSLLGEVSARENPALDAVLFDRAVAHLTPGHEMAQVIRQLGQLAPFRYDDAPLPFDPVGDKARQHAVAAHQQASSLLNYTRSMRRAGQPATDRPRQEMGADGETVGAVGGPGWVAGGVRG